MSKKWLVCSLLVAAVIVAGASLAVASEHETTMQYQAEVLDVDGQDLVVKMLPGGEVRTFTVAVGREFVVDGTAITVDKLVPGTILTATVVTSEAPEVVASVSGTVVWAQGGTVILRLDEGGTKQYKVDPDFEFMLNGEPATVRDLKKGMKVTAERIREDVATVVKPDTPITGKAPK